MIKSPLRYPGGKSRAIGTMKSLVPENFTEYREPMVGGGSFFIYLRQIYPHLKVWINDLNPDLFYFWQYAQIDSEKLAVAIDRIRLTEKNGHALFNHLVNADKEVLSGFERAVRFFILNRITFSGVVESGGFSQLAFEGRFTLSSIHRLANLGQWLQGVKITHLDYRELLFDGGKEVFTFLDPPYFKTTPSKLYGKKGILHTNFDHFSCAVAMQRCHHSWLITYDDSATIRQLFAFAQQYDWELQYGMNNYKQKQALKGKELFIANYPLPILPKPIDRDNREQSFMRA